MKREDRRDRIEGKKIILYDDNSPGPRILKAVEIITPFGRKRTYHIRKTSKGGYLFN
jgi:hypothetical protein